MEEPGSLLSLELALMTFMAGVVRPNVLKGWQSMPPKALNSFENRFVSIRLHSDVRRSISWAREEFEVSLVDLRSSILFW